jgi:preprotein translocase subunit SecA
MVIGTERHESRRIDNQLRGRSGRQGDPGHSAFFLSLQDDLMRIFPVDSMDTMLGKLGLEQGESITHPWVTKAIERAQGKVESRNFDIRKNILKYDDVMNDQRKVIFEQRIEMMDAEDVSETVKDMRHDVVEAIVTKAIPPRSYPEQWNIEQLEAAAKTYLNIDAPIAAWAEEEGIDQEIIEERLLDMANAAAAAKAAQYSPQIMRQVEKSILLQSIDGLWREHLVTLDHLSKVVGWRGVAQRDPLNEYKQEGFELFQQLLTNLRELVTTQLSHIQLQIRQPEPEPDLSRLSAIHIDPTTGENDAASDISGTVPGLGFAAGAFADGRNDAADSDTSLRPIDPKLLVGVARNAPCPCGSGKKFKHCHGAF